MMRYKWKLVLTLACLFSCNCEEEVCAGFSSENNDIVPIQQEFQLFESIQNSTIEFDFNSTNRTQKSVVDCQKNSLGFCECNCPVIEVRIDYHSPIGVHVLDSHLIKLDSGSHHRGILVMKDTSFYVLNDRTYNIYQTNVNNNGRINIQFLDARIYTSIDLSTRKISSSVNDDYTFNFLGNFATPSAIYTDVNEFIVRKNLANTTPQIVSKLYYQINKGVVAFLRTDGDLYYLRE